eukprot:Gb_29899 [translate_table: standard]
MVDDEGTGRGFGTIDTICWCAGESGAKVLLLTTQPSGITSKFAHVVALIPAQTIVDDQVTHDSYFVLPMGSLYEGTLFMVFEIVILRLTSSLGQTAEIVQSKHPNLE